MNLNDRRSKFAHRETMVFFLSSLHHFGSSFQTWKSDMILLCLLMLVSFGWHGCRWEESVRPSTSPDSPAASSSTETPSRLTDVGKITVRDTLGREVIVPQSPRRIVSIAPKGTELLFAIGAGDQVVGVTTSCNYPPEAQHREKVGGFSLKSLSLEKVIALHPDVVISTGEYHRPVIDHLERLQIPVIALGGETFESLYQDLTLLGKVTGNSEQADQISRQIRTRVVYVRQTGAAIPPNERLSLFYQAWDEPLSAAGPGSFMDEIIRLTGARNIFDDADKIYPQISSEALIARDPDVIIARKVASQQTIEDVSKKPGWSHLKAIRNGRVYLLDGDLIARFGPRIVDALEIIAQEIYPDRFSHLQQDRASP